MRKLSMTLAVAAVALTAMAGMAGAQTQQQGSRGLPCAAAQCDAAP